MTELIEPAATTPSPRRVRVLVAVSVLVIMSVAVLIAVIASIGEANTRVPIVQIADSSVNEPTRLYRRSVDRLDSLAPKGVWVEVDTTGGKLRVHRRSDVLREASCSAGSGISLRDPRNGRVWTFRTPTGERSVIRKVEDPVWVKPDWAFIEEGFEPPPLGARDRRDDFSLGAYALHLGDGYMIHGTVFQSLVGRPVTHGCIRLRDEDLEYVYKTVPAGARVFLY